MHHCSLSPDIAYLGLDATFCAHFVWSWGVWDKTLWCLRILKLFKRSLSTFSTQHHSNRKGILLQVHHIHITLAQINWNRVVVSLPQQAFLSPVRSFPVRWSSLQKLFQRFDSERKQTVLCTPVPVMLLAAACSEASSWATLKLQNKINLLHATILLWVSILLFATMFLGNLGEI